MRCCKFPDPEGEWRDVYDDPVRPRRSGYECPPDPLQVGAWTAIAVIMVLHYLVQVPLFRHGVLIADCIVASVLLLCVIVSKVTLELLPQQDDVVFLPEDEMPRLDQEQLDEANAPPGTAPCVFCRRFVSASCKHCSVCDKCVPDFDHHCRWLNSCVGGKNYRLFVFFMGAAWLGMAWVVGISIYTIQWCLRDRDRCRARLHDSYRSTGNAYIAILVFNFLVMLLAAAGAATLGKLILFHVYLNWTGQSTYEHIIAKRKKREEAGESKKGKKGMLEHGCCAIRRRRDFKKRGNKNNANGDNTRSSQADGADGEGGASESHEPADYSGRGRRGRTPSSISSPVLGNEPLRVDL